MTQIGLNISNGISYTKTVFQDIETSDTLVNKDDLSVWGLGSLLGTKLLDQVTEEEFFTYSNPNNGDRISAGDALYSIFSLDIDYDDGFADAHITSIGKNALSDYLNAAKDKHGKGTSEYKKALTYLFSGLLRDDFGASTIPTDNNLNRGQKAQKLAVSLYQDEPDDIIKYLNSGTNSDQISYLEVKGFYETIDVVNNIAKNLDTRHTSYPKQTKKILLTDFKNLGDKNATVDADDFKAFGLYNMAKGVQFKKADAKSVDEAQFFRMMDADNNSNLSTAEALFGIARYEIWSSTNNDGYANARLDQIGTENLKQYINLAKKFYIEGGQDNNPNYSVDNYKKALRYIFSALLPPTLDGRTKANEMGAHYATGAAKEKTSADIVAELNSTRDDKITRAELQHW